PHATHLIAESTLIPIDNSLRAQGIDFLRYADDILVFCSSEKEARTALRKIATTLDQQQRLMLQRHKTKLFNRVEFRTLCHEMVQDRPISDEEDRLLKIIKRYSGGNPCKVITYNSISASDWVQFSQTALERVLTEYLSQDPIISFASDGFTGDLLKLGILAQSTSRFETLRSLGHAWPIYAPTYLRFNS